MPARIVAPTWFTIAAVILLLWNLVGAYACIQQFRLGAEAYAPTTAYDRALFASMPWWYNWNFALAEVAGIGGCIALLARNRVATPLFVLSLLCVIVQYGYLFASTDLIAHKGVGTIYFPLFIAAVCVSQVWLALTGRRRGWLQGERRAVPAL
ncbi:hypothetical protein [Sphingomonas sp.]|uniref:hypothetical protein n=1 Tax=Sphingomonas sp. TaxID=28214 RepID=UPI003CC670C2